MKKDRELLKDALFLIESGTRGGEAYDIMEEIRARLAEKEYEPVAWMDIDGNVSDNNDCNCFPIPLYRHPPNWMVRLSDEEIEDICWTEIDRKLLSFARAIESKSLEKNK